MSLVQKLLPAEVVNNLANTHNAIVELLPPNRFSSEELDAIIAAKDAAVEAMILIESMVHLLGHVNKPALDDAYADHLQCIQAMERAGKAGMH